MPDKVGLEKEYIRNIGKIEQDFTVSRATPMKKNERKGKLLK